MRLALAVLTLSVATTAYADNADQRPNLASFGAGAIVVKDAEAYSDAWSGFWLLDEDVSTGYAPPKGDLAPSSSSSSSRTRTSWTRCRSTCLARRMRSAR